MKIIKQGVISASHAGLLRYNGWPSVITLRDGTLLAGWSGDRYPFIINGVRPREIKFSIRSGGLKM